MAHMRDKAVYCEECSDTCRFTANLDTGKMVKAIMPAKCKWPTKCPKIRVAGIFDRPFGERIIKVNDV